MTYQITKGVVKVTVCDEHLLVATGDARQTLPYVKHLNAAGAYIWGKLENAVPAEQIAESIAADYGISEKDARISADLSPNLMRCRIYPSGILSINQTKSCR